MKNIFKILVTIGLMIWTTSCEEYLQEDPKGQLATVYFWQSPADLDAAINALYQNIGLTFSMEYYYGQNLHMGDDIGSNPIGVTLGQYDRWDVVAAHDWVLNLWVHQYMCIKNCNFIINGVENTVGATAEEIRYTKAIAHYWRAFFYFYLVRSWGEVPVVTENEIDYNTPLSTEEEIYELIISDLLLAEGCRINYTKAPYILNGRNRVVGQAAAKATLAQVYLTMAGYPLNKGAEYYQLAAAKAKEVIDGVENGTYNNELFDECWKIFSVRPEFNDNHPEVLNAVYYNRDTQANMIVYSDYGTDIAGDSWNISNGEIKFWLDYPEGPRKNAAYMPKPWIQGFGSTDWWVDTDPPSRQVVRPAFMRTIEGQERFTDYDWTKPGGPHSASGDKCSKMVLLAEVYCWYAEAIGRSGQTNAKAIELLNIVRNRADGFGPVADRSTVGVPERDHVKVYTNIYPSTITANELAEAAYNEHGWEIGGCYSGILAPRYFDEIRMYRVKDHFDERKRDPMYEVAPGVFRSMGGTPIPGEWSDARMYMPYPVDEVMLNPNLVRRRP